jgi:hypothetical protein
MKKEQFRHSISAPFFHFIPDWLPRKLGHNELPTDDELKEFGRWAVSRTMPGTYKVKHDGFLHDVQKCEIIYVEPNTYEAALKLSHSHKLAEDAE